MQLCKISKHKAWGCLLFPEMTQVKIHRGYSSRAQAASPAHGELWVGSDSEHLEAGISYLSAGSSASAR